MLSPLNSIERMFRLHYQLKFQGERLNIIMKYIALPATSINAFTVKYCCGFYFHL